jgi:hypothetical protein
MKEVTVNTTPNPEIEKLRTEKERNEAKLRYCKNQLKALSQEEQNLERKARNHRIFTRGAMLEGFLQNPLLLTDEQVYSILKVAFHRPEVGETVRRLIEENVQKDENGDEGPENPSERGRNYTPSRCSCALRGF